MLNATSNSQEIISPNYPSNYPTNLRCRWTLDAPEGQQVNVKVIDMGLESHEVCEQDYIEFRDYPLVSKFSNH